MISFVQPPSVGNALRVFVTPPDGALWWRLLRRTSDVFTGPADIGAVLVADNSVDNVILDTTALVNGTAYVYRLFSWDGNAFTTSDPAAGTPATIYEPGGPLPQQIVADRIGLGLAAEIAAGRLKPGGNQIDVITAPFVLAEGATFPTVTVHMDSTEPGERFLGEDLYGEIKLADGTVAASEGWLARWSLTVLGVSLNSDERIALRDAVRRVVQANFGVFDNFGMTQIAFSQRDVEDTQSYAAPLYMTYGTFTCLAPAFVTDAVAPIIDIIVQPDATATGFGHGSGVSLLGGKSTNPTLIQAGFQ